MGTTTSHHEPLSGADLQPPGGSQPHGTANVFSPYGRASIRKSLRRRKSKRKKNKEEKKEGEDQVEGPSEAHIRKMDKLRKSFRDSFRKKKDSHVPESSKPHLWQSDESSVRSGTCQFYVKYLGCVEVFESRGMQVCEEALKVLRESRRRPIRGVLYVSGDGLRVVDDDTKGLIVDQTIEKVSFCAPDRNHERGFSYICRDGTTRRWMCHGFVACKESGERLSHAVGCAFAACLERKQKRDKQCGVTMTFDNNTSTFTRTGSFRQMSLTERLSDPQECKPTGNVPVKKVENPHAIERPHATPQCLQRVGSFRGFGANQTQQFPFKRQLSLRLNELPSNLARHNNQNSPDNIIDNGAMQNVNNNGTGNADADNTMVNAGFNDGIIGDLMSPNSIPRTPRSRQQSLPNVETMAPIPEVSSIAHAQPVQPENDADAVSAMCQQVSAGLSLLSSFSDAFQSPTEHRETIQPLPFPSAISHRLSPDNVLNNQNFGNENTPWNSNAGPVNSGNGSERLSPALNANNCANISRGEEWLSMLNAQPMENNVFGTPSGSMKEPHRNPSLSQLRSISLGGAPPPHQPSQFNFQPTNGRSPMSHHGGQFNSSSMSSTISYPPGSTNNKTQIKPTDPFDAEWASLDNNSIGLNDSKVGDLTSPSSGMGSIPLNPNNPFLTSSLTKAFQVQM